MDEVKDWLGRHRLPPGTQGSSDPIVVPSEFALDAMAQHRCFPDLREQWVAKLALDFVALRLAMDGPGSALYIGTHIAALTVLKAVFEKKP